MVVRPSEDTRPSTIFRHLTPSIVRLIAILYLGGPVSAMSDAFIHVEVQGCDVYAASAACADRFPL